MKISPILAEKSLKKPFFPFFKIPKKWKKPTQKIFFFQPSQVGISKLYEKHAEHSGE
jgi:hypothetical protein